MKQLHGALCNPTHHRLIKHVMLFLVVRVQLRDIRPRHIPDLAFLNILRYLCLGLSFIYQVQVTSCLLLQVRDVALTASTNPCIPWPAL